MPNASRQLDQHAPEQRRRGSRSRTASTVLGAILLLALIGGGVYVSFNGWDFLRGEGNAPVHAKEENFQKPVHAPEFVPGGSAEENLPYFTEVLRTFAHGDRPVQGEPIVDAIVAAGFSASDMQVSFDRTQTNLVADNIFVSVRVGAECLIGQVTTADRGAYAAVEPVVGPEQNLCLIGETRPIDWQ